MRLITQLSRVVVGTLFIFSGLVKLNDPVGFSYKLDEYFAPDVLNMPFFQPWVLEMAVFIVILEVILGVALLLGFMKRLTIWLLLAMIVFFTFLTFYSAYFNKVTDCGCFGDAIPLTPWESFGKDVVLLVLIVIILLGRNYIQPLFTKRVQGALMGLSLAGCIVLAIVVLNHLPLLDFRPYAVGKSIPEGMKSAEELGLEPPEYGTIYYLKNEQTGEEKKVTSKEYVADKWYEKKEWKLQSNKTESVLVKEGYHPPIHDFVYLMNDRDVTDTLLNSPNIFVLISYDINLTDAEAYPEINEFATEAQKAGYPFVGMSASMSSEIEQMRHELQTPFPFGVMDKTTLKTIVRSNPGILLLQNGKVAAKWHYNDLPDFEEVQKTFL